MREIPPSPCAFGRRVWEKGGGGVKKAETLKKNHEFRRMYQRGKSAVGGCMVVYCRGNGLDHNRLGLTASTKIGNAVKRNRARRRLREVYRRNVSRLLSGRDVVLVARARTLTASWGEMEETFLRLCGKLGLVRGIPGGNQRRRTE